MQRIIALLFPRSTYGWNSIATVALLLPLHAPTGNFSLLLAAFQRHVLPCHSVTSHRMLLACSLASFTLTAARCLTVGQLSLRSVLVRSRGLLAHGGCVCTCLW